MTADPFENTTVYCGTSRGNFYGSTDGVRFTASPGFTPGPGSSPAPIRRGPKLYLYGAPALSATSLWSRIVKGLEERANVVRRRLFQHERDAALAALACALVLGGMAAGQGEPSLLVMVSVDGLRPDYITAADARGAKVPHMRRFLKEGSFAEGVEGVIPTVTYPSHTTLVTGVSPAKHGIFGNLTFDPLRENQSGWYWYAEDIKVPTLWDVARQAGMTAVLALRPDGAHGDPPALGLTGDAPADRTPDTPNGRGPFVAYLDDVIAGQPSGHLAGADLPKAGDLAAFVHTGGTTGAPKVAAHTHANQLACGRGIAECSGLAPGEAMLGGLPLFHVNALIVTGIAPMFGGARVVWPGPAGYRDKALYARFWQIIEHYRIAAMSSFASYTIGHNIGATVFTGGAIRHTAVIPIAGDQVTNDIECTPSIPAFISFGPSIRKSTEERIEYRRSAFEKCDGLRQRELRSVCHSCVDVGGRALDLGRYRD